MGFSFKRWFKKSTTSPSSAPRGSRKKTRGDIVDESAADLKANLKHFIGEVEARLKEEAEIYWKKNSDTAHRKGSQRLDYRFEWRSADWKELGAIYDHTIPMSAWFKAEKKAMEKDGYVPLEEVEAVCLELFSSELRNWSGNVYFIPYIDLQKMEGWWVVLEGKRDRGRRGERAPYVYLSNKYTSQRRKRQKNIERFNAERIADELLLLADFGP